MLKYLRPTRAEAALLVLCVTLEIVVLSAVGGSRMIPVRWDVDGGPNDLEHAWIALSIAPLVGAAIVLMRNAMPEIDPLGRDALLRAGPSLRAWSLTTLGILAA